MCEKPAEKTGVFPLLKGWLGLKKGAQRPSRRQNILFNVLFFSPAVFVLFLLTGGISAWKFNVQMLITTIHVGAFMDVELDEENRTRAIGAALRALDKNSTARNVAGTMNSRQKEAREPKADFGFVLSGTARPTITKVYLDSPASRMGLKEGDVLLSFNEMSFDDENGEYADFILSLILEGIDPEKNVSFSIERDGEEIEVSARPEMLTSSWAHDLGNKEGIQHIALRRFAYGAAEDVAEIIEVAMEKGPVSGVLLDLRGNPGGLTKETSAIAGFFLPKGSVLARKTGKIFGDGYAEDLTENEERFPEILSVGILINGRSASASESLAAIVQDYGLGPVAGEVSRGKGTTQRVFDLPGMPELRMTISRFTGPKGRVIDGAGVTPDLEVEALDDGTLDWDGLINQVRSAMIERVQEGA